MIDPYSLWQPIGNQLYILKLKSEFIQLTSYFKKPIIKFTVNLFILIFLGNKILVNFVSY